MNLANNFFAVVAWVIFGVLTSALAQTPEVVLPYIPRDANVVSVLDVDGLLSSPLGVERGWAELHEQAYLDGSLTIPSWVRHFTRASHYIPGTRGEKWSVAFTPLDDPARMEIIAKTEGTEVQELEGFRSILSSRFGGYFVELPAGTDKSGKSVLGLITPATRQETAEWLRTSRLGTSLSSYLQQSVRSSGAQLVLAMDMNEMLDPVQIRYRLNGAASVKSNQRAKAALTLDFQSLQGVRLSVTAGKALTSELCLDFKRSIGDESQFIKPLLLELLVDAGSELEDFEHAVVSVSGNSVILRTALSDVSFRKILSLVVSPHGAQGAGGTTTEPSPPTSNDQAPYDLMASKRYYRAIIKNLEDLENIYNSSANSYNRTAGWHNSYANRIERMSTAGVHPSLQEFAGSISKNLRVLADSLRGSQIELQRLDNQIVYRTEYRYEPRTGFEWWWGPPRTINGPVMTPDNTRAIVHTNVDEVRQEQQKAIEAGAAQRTQVWKLMSDQRDQVEAEMKRAFGRVFVGD
ncbi:MAG: hypothetical protein R3C18_09340 [Planctomycetaceae bacterium]